MPVDNKIVEGDGKDSQGTNIVCEIIIVWPENRNKDNWRRTHQYVVSYIERDPGENEPFPMDIAHDNPA